MFCTDTYALLCISHCLAATSPLLLRSPSSAQSSSPTRRSQSATRSHTSLSHVPSQTPLQQQQQIPRPPTDGRLELLSTLDRSLMLDSAFSVWASIINDPIVLTFIFSSYFFFHFVKRSAALAYLLSCLITKYCRIK